MRMKQDKAYKENLSEFAENLLDCQIKCIHVHALIVDAIEMDVFERFLNVVHRVYLQKDLAESYLLPECEHKVYDLVEQLVQN